jgi:PAS domain S-box-containing protein
MKPVIRAVAARLKQLPPGAIFGLGLAYELALTALDYFTPDPMSFALWYLVGIAFVGWGAGRRLAIWLGAVAAGLSGFCDWHGERHMLLPAWILLWNSFARLLVFLATGWLTAEVTRLTRYLGVLAAERTRQLQEEADLHRATSARLADALDLNQKMLQASAIGIVVYRASGECVFANEAIARIAGGTLDQILAGNFRQLEGWRNSGLLSLAEEALAAGQPRSREIFHTTRFGKAGWVDAHMEPFIRSGELHLLHMAYDISERKQAEMLLRAQRDVGLSLSLTSDLPTALNRLLEIALQLGGVDSGGVFIADPKTGDFNMLTHAGRLSDAFIKQASRYPADSRRAQLIRKGQPMYALYQSWPEWRDEVRDREGLRNVAILPLCHEGAVIGTLAVASHMDDTLPAQSRVVLETIAAQAAGAIARIRTEAALQQSEAQILEISDREQARIGQDLHDGLCQQLVGLAFDANSLDHQLAKTGRSEAAAARRIADRLDQAITEARQLSRGLFPVRLEGDGLPSALEELARTTRERSCIVCDFESDGPVLVPDGSLATHLYRIAQEAVNNAVKHARPKLIVIRLRLHAERIELTVEDDGTGLDPAPAIKPAGLGLHIMEYRARTLGGTLQIARGADGGTLVSCCVPCPAG